MSDNRCRSTWACKDKDKRIAELEAERESASKDYADLLKDYRALKQVAQAVVNDSTSPDSDGEMMVNEEYVNALVTLIGEE